MNGTRSVLLALAFGWMTVARVAAAGGEAAFTPPVYTAYELKPGACYVLLKPKWPEVMGGDYPVCRAVLDNLNKFCDEPPQYDRRKVHPTTRNLREPNWERVDAKANLDLVKQTYLATELPEYRDGRWEHAEKRLLYSCGSGRSASLARGYQRRSQGRPADRLLFAWRPDRVHAGEPQSK